MTSPNDATQEKNSCNPRKGRVMRLSFRDDLVVLRLLEAVRRVRKKGESLEI